MTGGSILLTSERPALISAFKTIRNSPPRAASFSGGGPGENQSQWRFLVFRRSDSLTTSFMHCHNVSVTTVAPPPKLSKAHRKRHGVPLVRFRTINIEPMRRIVHSEGRAAETGIKRALHICRGHFRTYTPEKPLFGKLAGTIFVPQHARGTPLAGLVVQDYVVKASPTNPGTHSMFGSTAKDRYSRS